MLPPVLADYDIAHNFKKEMIIWTFTCSPNQNDYIIGSYEALWTCIFKLMDAILNNIYFLKIIKKK